MKSNQNSFQPQFIFSHLGPSSVGLASQISIESAEESFWYLKVNKKKQKTLL